MLVVVVVVVVVAVVVAVVVVIISLSLYLPSMIPSQRKLYGLSYTIVVTSFLLLMSTRRGET